MSYIGKTPSVGNFVKLDAITCSSTNTYNLLRSSVAFSPESANHMLVSLNGVIQAPNTAFTVTGSQITFIPSSGTLSSDDVIDFIMVYGNVLDIGTPSDASVTSAKIGNDQVDSQHLAAGSVDLEHMSSQSVDEDNLHISNAGTNGQFLSKQSGNAGGLTWADAGGGKILQVTHGTDGTEYAITSSDATTDAAVTTAWSITPSATSSKIICHFFIGQIMSKDGSGVRIRIYRKIGSGSYAHLTTVSGTATGSNAPAAYAGNFGSHFDNEDENRTRTMGGMFVDSPNTTSAVEYKIYAGQGDTGTRYIYVNRTRGNTDSIYTNQCLTHWTLLEVDGS